MKKLALLVTILVLGNMYSAYADTDYYSYSYARLSYVQGDVYVQRVEDLGLETGTVNLPIVEGEKLGTREGRAEIHFGRNNFLRVDRNTQMDFVRLPRRGDDLTSLHLLEGDIFLRVSYLAREKDFEFHTPDASFYILAEGLYRLSSSGSGGTTLYVHDGAAEAAGEEGSVLIENKEKLSAQNGIFYGSPSSFYANYADSFAEWNGSRDRRLYQAASKRYLPEDLYEYETELAANGRWMYERAYGYVWVPAVSRYSWRPYYNGRWVWYPIIGWTWVSHEPWGWCTSHYGRWQWSIHNGWYWIPRRRWRPAWVSWYCGPTYIGWSPLSYYGYPVVVINNQFYGRYSGSYDPVNNRAFVAVRKDQLRAPRISQVAVNKTRLSGLSRVSLSSKQPGRNTAVGKIRFEKSAAESVMKRTGVREIQKTYTIGKTGLKTEISSTKTGTDKRISIKRRAFPMSRTSVNKESSTVRSYRSSIKVYPSLKSSTTRSVSKTVKSGLISGSFSKIKTFLSDKGIKVYKSRTSSSTSRISSGSKTSALTSYSSSRTRSSYSKSRTHSYSRYSGPSYSRSYSPSSSRETRSYSTPSRSYSKSSSSVKKSSGGRGVSSSKSYSRSSSSRSVSRSRSSRSSSGKSSSSKVRKK